MAESNRSYSALSVGIALAAALIVGSCGGGGGTTEEGVAVYIKASNTGAGDQFGASVALSGDGNTLVIGAPLEDGGSTGVNGPSNESAADAGAAYVLIRSGMAWGQQAYVKASNTGAGDNFGFSVALSADGNTLAVGAPLEDSNATGIDGAQGDNTALNAGAVYVFTRAAGVWTQQAYIKASNTAAGDQFGFSVALSGDGNTLAVGAIGRSIQAGAVYVFTRGATWSEQAIVTGSNTGTGDQFGVSVALSGDGNTLAVGAPSEDGDSTGINGTDNNNATDSGAAYVFTRTGTVWGQQAYVKASNTGAGDQFGVSVSLASDGSTLAVGANNEASIAVGVNGNQADNSAAQAGAVYVYTRSGVTWSQQAYVKASNTQAGDRFGGSVALSGDGNALMVGAINEDGSNTGIGSPSNELALDAGAVYTYTRSGTVWTAQSYVKASNTGAGDGFGVSVALSSNGSTRAIGAPFEDSNATGVAGNQSNNGAADAGAVYIYQ